MIHTAAVPIGHVHVVDLVAGLLEKQKRARHVKFDVVGMSSDGDGSVQESVKDQVSRGHELRFG